MRKRIAFSISVSIHLLLILVFLVMKKPLADRANQPVVNLVFEEEEEEEEEEEVVYSETEPVPFAGFDADHYKGLVADSHAARLPAKKITEVEVESSHLRTYPDSEEMTPGTANEVVILPAAGEELFIPMAETILLDLPGIPEEGERGTGVVSGEEEITWTGKKRNAVKIVPIPFPDILVKQGVEVDLEVKITVSPAGRVTAVEILRSSGFVSIDIEVKQALSSWLFESTDETENDTGIIPIHFRLKTGGS